MTRTRHNTGFASGGVRCEHKALCFYSSSLQIDSFVLRNPPPHRATEKKKVDKMIKKLVLISALAFLALAQSFAQVTYEHAYPISYHQSFFVTDLGYDNYKYVEWDCFASSFSLYNLDHSPFVLDVQTPVSADSCLSYTIGYITSELFDCDSSTIEYAMLPESATRPLRVYRIDGTSLFTSVDSVYGWWCYGCMEASVEIKPIVNTPLGAKLYIHDPYNNQVLVYGLCGTLPSSISQIDSSADFVRVFPNPGTEVTNFEFALPESNQSATLILFNPLMQVIDRIPISGLQSYQLDNRGLGSGTYYYSIKSDNRVLQIGKFIIVK